MDSIREELKCSLCLEIFRHPKALPCIHTFCLECLQDYINTKQDFIRKNGHFLCPLCRAQAKPTDNNPNIQSWAYSFTKPHTIASIVENINAEKAREKKHEGGHTLRKDGRKDSADCLKKTRDVGASTAGRTTTSPLCSLCKLMSGSRWCEQCCQYLCGSCEKKHNQNPDTKVHVVVDAPQDESTLGAEPDQLPNNRPCIKHLGQIYSFYCEKCNQSCCSLCISSDHSSCFKVLPLEQAVRDKVQLSRVYMSLIGLQKDNLKDLQTMISTKLKENHAHHDHLYREIVSIRPMIDKILAEDEKNLLDELKVRTSSVTSELNRMKASCDNNLRIFDAKEKVLQSALAINTMQRPNLTSVWGDISGFMEKNSSQHEAIKSNLENVHGSHINFERSHIIHGIIKGTDASIGSLRGTSNQSSTSVSKETSSARNNENSAQHSAKLKLKNCRNLKLKAESPPLLTGICLLPDNVLAITDFSNNKLKMFDKERQLKYCLLPTGPYGVTYRPDTDQIVVSLPGSKELVYISSTLKIERHVKVLKEYSAVLFNNERQTLLCTSTTPGCIDILYNDVLVSTLGLSSNRRPLFSEPEYLALYSTQNILVSDWEKKALFCVDLKGNVISTFTGDLGVNDLLCPLGIAIDPNGLIYLADKESSRIFRFSDDFKFEAIVLTQSDYIIQPMAMAINSHGHLFVTEKSGYLKVFG